MPQRYSAAGAFGLKLGGMGGWGSCWMSDTPGVPLPVPGDKAAFGMDPPLPYGPPYSAKLGATIIASVWPYQPSSTTTFELLLACSMGSNDDWWSYGPFDYNWDWAIYEPSVTVLGTFTVTSTAATTLNLDPIAVPNFGAPGPWAIGWNLVQNAGAWQWSDNSYYPWVRVLTGGVHIQRLDLQEYPGQMPRVRGLAQGDLRDRTVTWEK
jgi:hypothetical protein